ncbi:hypothetical protein V2G26_017592 [Clonostachys chloroleuca]
MPPPGVLLNPSERVIIHKTPWMLEDVIGGNAMPSRNRSTHSHTCWTEQPKNLPTISSFAVQFALWRATEASAIRSPKQPLRQFPVYPSPDLPKKAAAYLIKITTYPELPHTQQPSKIPINACIQSVFGGAGPT